MVGIEKGVEWIKVSAWREQKFEFDAVPIGIHDRKRR